MAWYSDEQYMMIQDSREKKSVAASAFKQKTHCGKGGRVKFPSDYMTKKELIAMNGECKSYRMNDPISWSEFIEWPNEHKVAYIRKLREKFGVSDKHIAEMFDVSCNLFLMYVKELGLDTKCECDEDWSREKFYAWRTGGRTELVEENTDETIEPAKEPDLTKPMKWGEFKALTDEQKITYIQGIRNQFGAPDTWIGRELFGLGQSTFARVVKILNIGGGKNQGNNKGKWDKEGFMRWCGKYAEEVEKEESLVVDEPTELVIPCAGPLATVNTDEDVSVSPVEAVEPENDIPVSTDEPTEHDDPRGSEGVSGETHCAVPVDGEMNFKGNIDDILRTVKLLLSGSNVSLTVSWRVIEEAR